MDFNKQRKIEKALREKGKNPLLFLPCLIARLLVVAFMSAFRSIDMALSDSSGNFLGIKRREKRKTQRYEREMTALEYRAASSSKPLSAREKRRIQKALPHRALWKRAASFVMAAAFAMMTLPAEINVSAAADIIFRAVSAEAVTAEMLANAGSKADIIEADLYTAYQPDSAYPLNIENSVFNGLPSLTTITLGYSEAMNIGNKNFTNIAPDASAYIRADSFDDYSKTAGKLAAAGSEASNIWDKNGAAYAKMPRDISSVNSYSAADAVILKWQNLSEEPDGYKIYAYTNGKFSEVKDITADEAVSRDDSGTRTVCYTEITGAAARNSTVYAVRAYKNETLDYDGDRTSAKLFSKRFARTAAAEALTVGKPVLSSTMSNNIVTLNVSMPSDASSPSYLIIYAGENGVYEPVTRFTASDFTNGVYTYRDTNHPFDGTSVRKYVAIAYYDAYGTGSGEYTEADIKTTEYTALRSDSADITDAVLNSPQNLKYALIEDKSAWRLYWDAPADLEDFSLDVTYKISANGREITSTKDLSVIVPVDHDYIEPGCDVVFSVTSVSKNMTSGTPAEVTVFVTSESVKLVKVMAGSKRADIYFKEFPGTKLYTIYYSYDAASSKNGPSTQKENYVKISKTDCVKNTDGSLKYTIEDLTNDIPYTFRITSDAVGANYSSVIIGATPSHAPQPPARVWADIGEGSANINWDICYKDGTTEAVDGYFLTIKKHSGEIILDHFQIAGNTSYVMNKLENDVDYYAYVYSYVEVNGSIIESATFTRSELFRPTITVDNVLNLTAEPDEDCIKVSWSKVNKATKYYLYRTDASGEMITLDMGNKTSYEDKNVRNGVTYTYSVTAVREEGGKPYKSAMSEPQTAVLNVHVSAVQGLTVEGGEGCVILKWDKVNGAKGYYVECYSETENKWIRVADVGTTTFTHTGLENGTEYRYRVIAYIELPSGEIVEGIASEAQPIPGTAGISLPSPADFTVEAEDGQVNLKWSAVKEADGYEIYIVDPYGEPRLFDDVSKTAAVHKGLSNGTVITYAVKAYKYIDGKKVRGGFSVFKTVTVGIVINAPTDVTAKAGDSEVKLSWKKVDGADGYVVYCYNTADFAFNPVGIVTSTNFTHTGLTNGRTYTYMITAFKNIGDDVQYSGYSLSVSSIPQGKNGTTTDSNSGTSDYRIYITGTTPFGMSNSNVISAFAEKGAFNSDIDVRFTLSPDTVAAVQNVLNFYGEGIESFMMYPMDISLYVHGTDTRATINPGYYMTLTIPVPDDFLPYSDYISVVHVSDLEQLEILPAIHVNVGGVECIQFTANSFSPYAFVVYLPDVGENTGAGTSAAAAGSVEYQTTSASAFMCTYLPDIYRRRKRNKLYKVVRKSR